MSQFPIPQTLDEWATIPDTNSVSIAVDAAASQIDRVVSGKQQLALIFAPPGVGVSTLLEGATQGFAKQQNKPVLPSADVAHKMLEHFDAASGNRPIIIEEARGALSNPQAIQLLRSAIDPTSDRRRCIGAGRKKKTINLKVPLILATNAKLGELVESARQTLRASIFTIQPAVLVPSFDWKLWEYFVHRALMTDLLLPSGLAGQELDEAIAAAALAISCFTEHLMDLATIHPRVMIHIAKFARENPSFRGLEHPSSHPVLGSLFELPGMKLGGSGAQPDWALLIRERLARDRRSKTQRLPPPCAASSERLAPHNVKDQRSTIEA